MPSLGHNSRLYFKYNLKSLREILILCFIYVQLCGHIAKKLI